jgi:cellulose synthase/poly-beta-1,6-N-acetylglucosamine synthase-like glycosyltransferase
MWPFEAVLAIYALKIIVYFLLMRRKDKMMPESRSFAVAGDGPSVDIVLPMYNEETVVVDTISNLLRIEYGQFSIIVVDDGSTDDCYMRVKAHFDGHPQVRLVRQPNMGKSSALNRAVSLSHSEIVVSIDADTCVAPDAIRKIVAYFEDDRVAAVAGHIKVGNRVNLLTEMQYQEYIAIWDNDRAFSEIVNGILIVPGALGAFRRSAVNAVGGFRSEVIAEDTELTLRLLNQNYRIRNAADAVAYTEAPDNLRMFFRQRVRWTTGLTQGLVQHNKRLFGHSNGWLVYLILPFTWSFRLILPFLLPLIDYYFIYAYFLLKLYPSLTWWASILLAEGLTNAYLLRKNRENVRFFQLLVAQRLYRHLLFCNYWVILLRRLNGTLFNWRKIPRKGNVRLD